jgi:hypothetical protein
MPIGRRKPRDPALPSSLNISGVSGGSMVVGVGSGNTFVQGSTLSGDAAQLERALTALRDQVEAKAGPLKGPALEQVAALGQAAKSDPPDVGGVKRAREWFMDNLPSIVPALAEVLVNPSVDSAVKAAAHIAEGSAGQHGAPERTAEGG